MIVPECVVNIILLRSNVCGLSHWAQKVCNIWIPRRVTKHTVTWQCLPCHVTRRNRCVLINLYEVYKFVYTKSVGKKRENEKEKRDQYWHEFLYRAVFMLKPVFLLLMYLVFNAPCISFFYGVIYNFVVQFVLYSFSVIWSLCINFPLFLAKIFTYFFLLRHPLSHFINYIDMLTV